MSATIIRQLDAIEQAEGDGELLIGRARLRVTSLDKIFFPKPKYTKGDVLRYYVEVSKALLPVMKDRPLVLKRFPNGVTGDGFFQQKAPDDAPPGVRVETIVNDQGEHQRRLVGDGLVTLLYTIQIGSVSVDPWHSRVQSLDYADYSFIDLDPGPRAGFKRVIAVGRWVKETLDDMGLQAGIKTSGKSGLHILIPLPPRATDETSRLLAELIATRVARAHPREATIERTVKERPAAAVYVDFLQNVKAKTIAAAYAVRAVPDATVSTPLEWSELTDDLSPKEFTIDTVPDRLKRLGDLWAAEMKRKNTLRALQSAIRAR
jgi:bifunctional non-homologous end joining protein LigD